MELGKLRKQNGNPRAPARPEAYLCAVEDDNFCGYMTVCHLPDFSDDEAAFVQHWVGKNSNKSWWFTQSVWWTSANSKDELRQTALVKTGRDIAVTFPQISVFELTTFGP